MAYVRFYCIYVQANWTGLNLYYHKSKKLEYNMTLLSHVFCLNIINKAQALTIKVLLILIHVYH